MVEECFPLFFTTGPDQSLKIMPENQRPLVTSALYMEPKSQLKSFTLGLMNIF